MTQNSPWELQKRLMEISGQEIKTTPHATSTSALYAALILEEVSELMEGLRKSLDRIDDDSLNELHFNFTHIGRETHLASVAIRKIIANLPKFSHELTREEAIEIADATTDIAVVNCGFAVASGFDGDALYDDTVGSNLSKANPETGVIDKTPDGKWIKGVAYREPNLGKVIYGE